MLERLIEIDCGGGGTNFRLVMLLPSLLCLPLTVCDKLALELHDLPLNIPLVKATSVEVERQEPT